MNLERIIARLEALKVTHAVADTTQPSDPTAYGYGIAVGKQRGIQEALGVLKGELEDEDERERAK